MKKSLPAITVASMAHRRFSFPQSVVKQTIFKTGLLLLMLIFAMPLCTRAQYTTSLITSPTLTYIYVGSLNRADNDLGNMEKLKVEVFGGSWASDDLGETTYYIGNRGGLNITRTIIGSSNNNFFTLQAYDNGTNNIDFYIVSANWTAIAVRAFLLDSSVPVTQSVTTTASTTTPSGGLHTLTIIPVITTDEFGNMGIGTNTIDTDYKLSVGGGIRAKEIIVETGWADYVFDDDYRLTPLNKVADYVHLNHHLPDVPSAAEIKNKGVNVGATEAVLLKKIEELTLYLIEKDKEINQQKAINVSQAAQLQQVIQRLNTIEHDTKTTSIPSQR